MAIAALAEVAQATSLAGAGHLAVQLGMQVGSALTRCSRLLRHERIADQLLTAQLMRVVCPAREPALLALDWTAWPHGLRMLVAAAVVGRRAIPVQAAAFSKPQIPRSQNLRETMFLQRLAHPLRALDQATVLVCDRGFRRVSWLRHCQAIRQAVVVRLVPDVMVDTGTKGRRRLRAWPLQPGQALDLGGVWLRQDGAVCVRVVGVEAPGQAAPWWLVTDVANPLPDLIARHDQRMAIAEQCRDTKGCRFGVRLAWTHGRTPASLARFLVLLGAALVLWIAVGQAMVEAIPTVRLPCKRQGPRLSLVRVGQWCLPTMARRVHLSVQCIRAHLPPPQLRGFSWLPCSEGVL